MLFKYISCAISICISYVCFSSSNDSLFTITFDICCNGVYCEHVFVEYDLENKRVYIGRSDTKCDIIISDGHIHPLTPHTSHEHSHNPSHTDITQHLLLLCWSLIHTYLSFSLSLSLSLYSGLSTLSFVILKYFQIFIYTKLNLKFFIKYLDDSVSRQHAMISNLQIHDLKSANGTRLNGIPLQMGRKVTLKVLPHI